jgi:hypothetical protein
VLIRATGKKKVNKYSFLCEGYIILYFGLLPLKTLFIAIQTNSIDTRPGPLDVGHVAFHTVTVVNIKAATFSDVMPCSLANGTEILQGPFQSSGQRWR